MTMDEIIAPDLKRNSQPQNSGGAARNNGERFLCRNQRCRSKLPIPTENDHKAFCSQYCYEQFYQWRCKVCEEPILKGRRRKSPDHCHAERCRKDFRRYPEAFSYPYSQTVKQDQKSAHFTEAFFGIRRVPGWHWDATICEDEHWLYAHGRVVAIVCCAEGDWKIRYPAHDSGADGYNARGGPQARNQCSVLDMAYWRHQTKARPPRKTPEAEWRERDLADEQYVAADEERLRTEPVDLFGNYAPPDSGEWIDWPPDEGAP